MAYIRYSNGNILEWDETISVGTLIRTYYKGYWVLTGIEFPLPKPRVPSLAGTIFDNYAIEWSNKDLYEDVPIFQFTQVLKEDGTKSKNIVKSCSAYYCSRVTEPEAMDLMAREILAARDKYAAILNYLPA
jgi:hypothetical protein